MRTNRYFAISDDHDKDYSYGPGYEGRWASGGRHGISEHEFVKLRQIDTESVPFIASFNCDKEIAEAMHGLVNSLMNCSDHVTHYGDYWYKQRCRSLPQTRMSTYRDKIMFRRVVDMFP